MWLQRYFDTELSPIEELADALTFHAFEIDSIEGDTLDVKVLPNRAADCLSHRGVARELSAILDIPAKPDPLRAFAPTFPKAEDLSIAVEDARAVPRYMGALVKGVKVGPSPAWLREALESVGQRSINNIVDATNFVMLDIGQPLHAFDAGKIEKEGKYSISVRGARDGEKALLLTGEEAALPEGALVITNGASDAILGVAGIKGGRDSGVVEATTDLIIEAANFDGPMIRVASQRLKLWTEAGKRFQNKLSPELAPYALAEVVKLILDVAGGELVGATDFYPAPVEATQVSCSLTRINGTLGTELSGNEIESIFTRLGFAFKKTAEEFTVDPPFERNDITIPADLVEEVGRIWGYDRVPATQLPPLEGQPDQARFRGTERMKDQLVEEGFTEVSTQSFAKKGDVRLANPLDVKMPWLRTSLEENLADALAKAKLYAPTVFPPKAKPKLFEVGAVFPKDDEHVELRMTEKVPAWGDAVGTVDNLSIAKLEDYGKEYEPKKYALSAFKPYSLYPFIARDIALWVPAETTAEKIEKIITDTASVLLVRLDKFDEFQKEGKTSYAFRLIFQADDRTLTDDEINAVMETISAALRAKGYEIR